jgi:hypothetical protein
MSSVVVVLLACSPCPKPQPAIPVLQAATRIARYQDLLVIIILLLLLLLSQPPPAPFAKKPPSALHPVMAALSSPLLPFST